MPERERALRIGVNDETAAAGGVGAGREMRGERALAGAALAGGERDDVHGSAPWLGGPVDPAAGMVNEGLNGSRIPALSPPQLKRAFTCAVETSPAQQS